MKQIFCLIFNLVEVGIRWSSLRTFQTLLAVGIFFTSQCEHAAPDCVRHLYAGAFQRIYVDGNAFDQLL